LGSTFDAFVKRWLAHKLGIADHPKVHSSSLLGKINFPSGIPREEIERAAANVAELYINNGLAIQLIEEGLYDVELNIFMPFGEDFTILGLPDGAINDKKNDINIPFDWKVRGYKSKSSPSPTPGYKFYLTASGKVMNSHSRCEEPLEKLNENWAIQLGIYAWLLNTDIPPGTIDMPVAIDEITYASASIIFTKLRTVVSKEFQQKIYNELKYMWKHTDRPEPSIASPMQCKAYGKLCPAAPLCKYYYSRWIKNEFGR
jgi:hypothetical protein